MREADSSLAIKEKLSIIEPASSETAGLVMTAFGRLNSCANAADMLSACRGDPWSFPVAGSVEISVETKDSL